RYNARGDSLKLELTGSDYRHDPLNAKNKAVKVLRWRFFGVFPENTTCALTALSVFRALQLG
ncbi:hypothetical protein, partial [Listeria monocytogenes]|uniref:hypothetical protein n=1 Tax=Listeria monocytogenes TaxID=1639 RepID=UPI001A8F0339